MSREGKVILQHAGQDTVILTANEYGQLVFSTETDEAIHIGLGRSNIETNLALGKSALSAVTTGNQNIAVGYEAMERTTVGDQNVAVGYQAMVNNEFADGQVAIGTRAMRFIEDGTQNVAVGFRTMAESIHCSYNVALGAYALNQNLTSNRNVAIGHYCLAQHLNGGYNVAIGQNAARYQGPGGVTPLTDSEDSIYIGSDTRGVAGTNDNSIVIGTGATGRGDNTASWGGSGILKHHFSGAILVGEEALLGGEGLRVGSPAVIDGVILSAGNTVDGTSVALGSDSLGSSTGASNLALAPYALFANTTGSDNVAAGRFALRDNTIGLKNTAIGKNALLYNIDGSYNVAIGESVANNWANGSTQLKKSMYSVYIGHKARGLDDNDDNSIVIGYLANGAGANTVVIGNDNITNTYLKGNVHFEKTVVLSFGFTSATAPAGTHYIVGNYNWPTAGVTLTQASLTVSHGSANNPYNEHVSIVVGGAGTVDTGQVGIEVFGDTFDETTGVLTVGDTESLTEDITTLALNEYLETDKKFVGAVVIRLYTVSGTPVTYSAGFNYGFVRYADLQNNDFDFDAISLDGRAGASDSSFDISVKHHSPTGWTYAATGFIPGNGEIIGMRTDLPSMALVSGEPFSWKRNGVGFPVNGAGKEGILIGVATGSTNSVDTMSGQVFVTSAI